jgi:hypothetical protein
VKHQETHPNLDVEGCFGCRVSLVHTGLNSTTTRGAVVNQTEQKARGWDKDMPAYRRLRQQGYQPRSIDGAARLEATATSAAQVEGRPDIEKLVTRGVAE